MSSHSWDPHLGSGTGLRRLGHVTYGGSRLREVERVIRPCERVDGSGSVTRNGYALGARSEWGSFRIHEMDMSFSA